jgi:hypothetical protein
VGRVVDPARRPESGRPRRDRARGWLGNLAAALLGLVVAGVLLEVLVVLIKGEQPKFPRRVVAAPWGLRYNQPGAEYRHKSADGTFYFRINRQGMRADRDYGYEKPPGVRRILSLGDSFTIGFEVEVEECFSSVLERQLHQAGELLEVLNAGVSGFSTAEAFLYLQRELIKYDPDVVLLSYFENDLSDNARANLFRLENGTLVQSGETYLPVGRVADLMNENRLLNILSERSNAFVYLKEGLTDLLKSRMVLANQRKAEAPAEGATTPNTAAASQEQLTAAIVNRMYLYLREREIPFVVHSIPTMAWDRNALVETFPSRFVDWRQPGLYFVPSKEVLDPFVGKQLLVRQRSHFHWTPFSHEVAGKNLAKVVLERKLLAGDSARPEGE